MAFMVDTVFVCDFSAKDSVENGLPVLDSDERKVSQRFDLFLPVNCLASGSPGLTCLLDHLGGVPRRLLGLRDLLVGLIGLFDLFAHLPHLLKKL